MGTSSAATPPPPQEPGHYRAAARWAQAAAVFALSGGSVFVEMAFLLGKPATAAFPAFAVLLAAVLAVRWKLHREPSFLAAWVLVSAAFAVVSATTGLYNGLTDEPYATPAFAAQWWPNLYSTPVMVAYTQYGPGVHHLSAYYVYLPLLTLVQIPGLDYRWLSLAAWGLAVLLQRRNGTAVVAWGSLYVGLLAANGFNDYVPIVLLTLAFLSWPGRKGKVAEIVGLGLKQFANVFVVGYHLYHRRWRAAALAVVVTLAFLAPFLLVDPLRVWCGAVLVTQNNCSSFAATLAQPISPRAQPIYAHLNYYLWPIWVLATFVPRWAAATRGPEYANTRREAAALLARPGRVVREDSNELSLLSMVMALRLRDALRRARRPRSSGPST